MNSQPIFDIAEICHKKGINKAIISSGSRNALLILAFVRHPKITCYSISDERSAAFVGLGMSLKTNKPTVLICTSGSAVLNYAPAIIEAYFAQSPLLILTADRPPEWIGQLDGQTIYQESIFGKHIKKSFSFPDNFDYPESQWHCHRLINEAINITGEFPQGPVHINLPFREPFYLDSNEIINYSNSIKIINNKVVINSIYIDYLTLNQYDKILIIAGQNEYNFKLTSLLSSISNQLNIPIITDIISNGHDIENSIKHQDIFLKIKNIHSNLQPELIITFGLSVISKSLKIFIRQNPPTQHWHIQPSGEVADTFQCLTDIIRTSPLAYFKNLNNESELKPKDSSYYDNWQKINKNCQKQLQKILNNQSEFNEFSTYNQVIFTLPKSIDLHLANSMAVRYANMIGLYQDDIEVYCNRGTSGIDGSNSTALGSALSTERLTVLLTGDMAFFYDRNAFWHNYLPKNLKIIIFNNHGGGIFRMIEGPRNQLGFREYFETKQKLTAKNLAEEFGLEYVKVTDFKSLKTYLLSFLSNTNTPSILEIFNDSELNQKVYADILNRIKERLIIR